MAPKSTQPLPASSFGYAIPTPLTVRINTYSKNSQITHQLTDALYSMHMLVGTCIWIINRSAFICIKHIKELVLSLKCGCRILLHWSQPGQRSRCSSGILQLFWGGSWDLLASQRLSGKTAVVRVSQTGQDPRTGSNNVLFLSINILLQLMFTLMLYCDKNLIHTYTTRNSHFRTHYCSDTVS